MTRNGWRRSATALAAITAASIAVLAGCTPTSDDGGGGDGPDNGTTLTMWARNTSNNLAQVIVFEYNRTHENQIELTTLPNDTYQQKVAAAAATGSLPDLLASDVVYSPNYVQQGLFLDITDRLQAEPFFDDLSPAHIEAASLDGALYGAPFILDSSLIHYNKDLFEEAGLDPEAPPTDFDELYEYATAIRENVGGDSYGFYFAGNCAGCNAYTMFGYLAAAGEPPFLENGTVANFDNDVMREVLDLYKRMWDEGLVPESAKTDDGSTWVNLFNQGTIGILPRGTSNFLNLKDAPFEHGVVGLPAPDGSRTSGFVGGDVLAISSTSQHVDQAWDFVQWALSDANQVEVVARTGSLPSRVDLADNEYSSANAEIVIAIEGLATGYTPATTGYGSAINSATGPWLKMIRDYIFNGNPDALTEGEAAIQAAIDAVE